MRLLTLFLMLFLAASPPVAHAITSYAAAAPATAGKLVLTDEERAWINQQKSVTVAVRNGWMPIEYRLESESNRGVALDYLREISKLTGLKFNFIEYSGNAVDAKKVQVISGVIGKTAIDNYTVIDSPYLNIPYAVYVHKSFKNQYQKVTVEDLRHAKVAIYKNGPIVNKLKAAHPQMQLIYVDIADEAFEYLGNQQIDAYIGNELVIDYHIEFHRLQFVEKSSVTAFKSLVRMAVRSDEPMLHAIISKALKQIGPNNPKIMEYWKAPPSLINTLLQLLLGVLMVVMAAMVYWLFSLRRKAKRESLENQRKIWHQANYDLQTGLPNRNFYEAKIQQVIKQCADTHTRFALLFIDLDDFKTINDISGHSVGDQLLKEVGVRLVNCVTDKDFTARLGGDEFVVIVNDFIDFSRVDNLCQQILNVMRLPFRINHLDYHITASIGVAKYVQDAYSSEELLSYADLAMYASKKLGRNRYMHFSSAMQAQLNLKNTIANDLRTALLTHQFELVYQPIVNLQTLKSYKAEALIRWHHPQKGLINPDQFIVIAEETGMIHELGCWILNQVVKDLTVIRANLGEHFKLGINISPLQFTQPQYLDDFMRALAYHQLAPEGVCFEITEGLLLDPSKTVIETIRRLKAQGVQFSIDDFGTGYSALAYLKKFDIDFVKIDKSFISHLDTDHYNRILCESIILMAHKLNIQLIAEGVEYQKQEDILRELQCDYVQGYLYGKPMPLATLIERETAVANNLY